MTLIDFTLSNARQLFLFVNGGVLGCLRCEWIKGFHTCKAQNYVNVMVKIVQEILS